MRCGKGRKSQEAEPQPPHIIQTLLLDKSRRPTGIATLMRNYRTGLFTDDVILAPLDEAFLGISQGPSATLRPWIELVEIITSLPATSPQGLLPGGLTLTRTGLASRPASRR